MLPRTRRGMHVVGYSYGGAVALALAHANPDLIKTLTLIEPVCFFALRYTGERAAYAKFQEVRTRFNAALARGERENAMRDFLGFWTGRGSWDALDPAARLSAISQTAKIWLDWEASFAADPGISLLSRLGPRTLLVRGDRSPWPMVKLVDALHALMPGSRLVVVRGAGHLLPLSHSASLTEVLLAELSASNATVSIRRQYE
jgi:pimeloyl-ACP methyl ester carboxylesterase